MFRKPWFWIAFALAAVLSTVFAIAFFADAFPLVTLDLSMDREAALGQARQLAEERGWGPEGFQQAASFGVDGGVQSYVELEGGGKEAYAEMLAGELFSPYTWEVRHFRPGETTETRVRFTPDGRAYGFHEILPEDEPGASLDQQAARRIAEHAAVSRWDASLGEFELAEASQEVRPGGRTDHTFVYERPNLAIGEEGRYRLRLTVAGDRFTELTHFVKVPEAFSRRYEEMRSTNNFVALGAIVAMLALYLAGGCGVGLFLLFRERWVIWKTPLLWGLVVAFLQLLTGLNQLPLAWMGYDTAVSTTNFLVQNVALQLAGFVASTLFFTLVFMGAESLTRRAFPNHLQFWRVWSRDAARSPQVLGYTVAGYLLIGVFFAYDVGLYFISHSFLGWWSPSDALFNPDSLATYLPWLTAIASSLQAGFMEECLFRAVPLAGAALLGKRFGRPGAWIFAAMILQALIFGAGHANYPTQPAYARVVELILPSIGFGLVYLRFGLLPVIVLHFAFDVVWFALPLFVSQAPGAWVNQVVVVAVTLVPLLLVLGARLRAKRWRHAGEELYNRAWTPAPLRAAAAAPPPGARAELPSRVRHGVYAAGVAGLVLWIFSSSFSSHSPPLDSTRAQTMKVARQALAQRGIELDDSWKTLSGVEASTGLTHDYVWQEGGEELFRELLGRYLPDPRWRVRFARFEGEVAERAEEYQVQVSGQGEVTRFQHRLPEGRGGADLPEEEARRLARAALAENYAIDPAALEEVSATPTKQPQRRDWTFTFKEPGAFPLEDGEARLVAEVAGDEVAHTYRYVHLPEEWERHQRNRATLIQVVTMLSGVTLFLIFAAAIVAAVLRWIRRKLAVGIFVRCAALMLGIGLVDYANGWPALQVGFSTAQPFWLQSLTLLVPVIGVFVLAFSVAFAAGLVHGIGDLVSPSSVSGFSALLPGLALGTAAAGLAALADRLGPSSPAWADYSAAGDWVPFLGAGLGPVNGFVLIAALLLLIFASLDAFTRRWSRRQGAAVAVVAVLGLALAGTGDVESLPLWLAAGLLQGALLLAAYLLVLRHDLTLVLPTVAMMVALGTVREGLLDAYPAALPGAVVGVVLMGLVLLYWFEKLRASSLASPSLPPSDSSVDANSRV